jgi:hypothetical protein
MFSLPWRKKPHKKSDDGKLALILERQDIDLVVDVGANLGQTRDRLRHLGFKGNILSIEPLIEAHATFIRAGKERPAVGNHAAHGFRGYVAYIEN